MPITVKQLEARRKHIGASDMPAILGKDRFATKYDKWAEKTGRLELSQDSAGPAAEAGNFFEGGILDWAEVKIGKLRRNQYRSRPDLHLGANLDAIVVATNEPVNAKAAGLFGPIAEPWGENGTDDVPVRVMIQAQAELLCCPPKMDGVDGGVALIPAFLAGRGFRMFVVYPHAELQEIIADASVEFWEKYVESDTPPPDTGPTPAVAKALRRIPEKIVTVDPWQISNWIDMRREYGESRERLEAAQRKLLAAMGDAEAAEGDEYSGSVTYFEQQRNGTKYRVLRHRKGLITNVI